MSKKKQTKTIFDAINEFLDFAEKQGEDKEDLGVAIIENLKPQTVYVSLAVSWTCPLCKTNNTNHNWLDEANPTECAKCGLKANTETP